MNRLWYVAAALSAAAWAQDRGALPLPASGNVTLPLDEYNRLVDLAANPPKKPETPPVAYTLESAEMKFQVAGEAATGTIELHGEVIRKGAVEIPLVRAMTVMDARRQGADLPLTQANGIRSAVLSGPGEFAVTLDAGLPLRVEAGQATLYLPVPSVGAARLTLTVPGDRTVVNVSDGLITARHSSGGQTTVEAALAPGQTSSLWWGVREAEPQPAAPKEVRYLSDVKTLVTVGEADLSLTALVDVTVVQGDPAQFQIALPAGYEVVSVTGATVESAYPEAGALVVRLASAAPRSHQFLVALTKATSDARAEIPILGLRHSQRETGELLVEGEGAMELTARESGSLKRMDLKEVSPFLRGLARHSLEAAFRYHRQDAEAPGLALAWTRFPDSSLLAAVAQEAQATTLVTAGGKSLTEVKLTVDNQAQAFLKVVLPAGATLVSAEVAGERVKPVEGADGNRVPLLRSGFRPNGPYAVSFVYMDSTAAFARKGGLELALPRMDVPIGLVRWEVFVPERYKVTHFGGNVVAADLLPGGLVTAPGAILRQGEIGGVVKDASGAVVPHAQVSVVNVATGRVRIATTDDGGHWMLPDIESGRLRITVASAGFNPYVQNANYDSLHPASYSAVLQVGSVSQTLTTLAGNTGGKALVDSARADTGSAFGDDAPFMISGSVSRGLSEGAGSGGGIGNGSGPGIGGGPAGGAPGAVIAAPPPAATPQTASPNVVDLQKRVAGVLPIPIDVPHAGTSFRFVRPLVVDEPTTVTFSYKTR